LSANKYDRREQNDDEQNRRKGADSWKIKIEGAKCPCDRNDYDGPANREHDKPEKSHRDIIGDARSPIARLFRNDVSRHSLDVNSHDNSEAG